jgi:hypothetical protein
VIVLCTLINLITMVDMNESNITANQVSFFAPFHLSNKQTNPRPNSPTPSPSNFPTAYPTAIPSTPPTSLPTADPTVNTCVELSKGTRMLFQLNMSTSGPIQPLNCVGIYCHECASKVISAHCDVVDVDVNDKVKWECDPTSFLPSSYKLYNYTVACQQCPGRNTFFKTIGSCELSYHLDRSEIYPFAAAVSLLAGVLLCLLFGLYFGKSVVGQDKNRNNRSQAGTSDSSEVSECSQLIVQGRPEDFVDSETEVINKNQGLLESSGELELSASASSQKEGRISPVSSQKNVIIIPRSSASSSSSAVTDDVDEAPSNTSRISSYQRVEPRTPDESLSQGAAKQADTRTVLINVLKEFIISRRNFPKIAAYKVEITTAAADGAVRDALNSHYGDDARHREYRDLLFEFVSSNACFSASLQI